MCVLWAGAAMSWVVPCSPVTDEQTEARIVTPQVTQLVTSGPSQGCHEDLGLEFYMGLKYMETLDSQGLSTGAVLLPETIQTCYSLSWGIGW